MILFSLIRPEGHKVWPLLQKTLTERCSKTEREILLRIPEIQHHSELNELLRFHYISSQYLLQFTDLMTLNQIHVLSTSHSKWSLKPEKSNFFYFEIILPAAHCNKWKRKIKFQCCSEVAIQKKKTNWSTYLKQLDCKTHFVYDLG